MKKFVAAFVVISVMIVCVCCGPYTDYAGTYSRSDASNNSYTVTLSASGNFRFERKLSKSSSLYGGPLDNDDHNVRKGTFTDQDGVIVIKFSYYDEAQRMTVTETATAKIVKDKLIISGSDQIKGSYTKK